MRFQNKVVLITGASRGIGKATALEFAKEGAKIIIVYHKNLKKAENAQKEIILLGGESIIIECDVSSESQVQQMTQESVRKFGKIDILINNAGIVFDIPFLEKTVEQFKQTIHTNLLGTFLCSKYVSQVMSNDGSIINIASTNGINCFNPDSMDYDASKAGIINLTYNLAKELAPKIRVNAIAPGWVSTDMNADLPQDFIEEESEKIYLKRFAEPKEIAYSVLFLASDQASYITGSILKVDGGY